MTRQRHFLWGAVIVALVLLASSVVAKGGFRRYWKLQGDVRALEERRAKLTDENARLRREAQALQDDLPTIERAAREELGFVKQGELVLSLEGR